MSNQEKATKNIFTQQAGQKFLIKTAVKMLKKDVCPPSTVIANLILMLNQKLPAPIAENDWFRNNSHLLSNEDKKKLVFVLDEFKKPTPQKQAILEAALGCVQSRG